MWKMILPLLLLPFSLQAGTMTGYIEVRLVILPDPCVASALNDKVSINCGNNRSNVQTHVEKREIILENGISHIVTITY